MAKEKKEETIKILGHDDFYNPMMNYLKNDGFPGLPTCFRALNKHYSHKQGGVTDWTGFAASGKTYVCLEVLLSLSERYGKRHGIWLPDLGSDNEIMQKLLKMKTGKDFHDKYNNKITQSEIAKELQWLLNYFVIFKKKDFNKGITPLSFWEKIANYKDDVGKLDTGLADSWKNFKHVYSGREDLYLDETLSIRNEIAEESQVHLHTIAHAVKPADSGRQSKKGPPVRRPPTALEIKGGGAWDANGKTIITIDRPDLSTTDVDIYVNKVKPEDVGIPGDIIGKIKLDPRKGRYFETIGVGQYYAYEWEKLPVQEEIKFTTEQVVGQLPF